MKDIAEQEVIDIADMDVEAFNEFAAEQGWSDGMPLYVPTEAKVAKFVETVRGDNRPYPPVPPRQVVPTLQSMAANAVMAGCKPEYFPVVTAALRGVLDPEYNLHGSLATTHSCAPVVMVSGPIRHQLEHQLRLELLRPGLAAQRHDRPRARPDAAQHRRRQALARWTARPRAIPPSSPSASARTRRRIPGRPTTCSAASRRATAW